MGKRYSDQRYMTEGLKLMLGFVFWRLKLHRAEAASLPHNAASRAALTNHGVREDGHAREYLCIDGAWQDHVPFGILRDEWAASLVAVSWSSARGAAGTS